MPAGTALFRRKTRIQSVYIRLKATTRVFESIALWGHIQHQRPADSRYFLNLDISHSTKATEICIDGLSSQPPFQYIGVESGDKLDGNEASADLLLLRDRVHPFVLHKAHLESNQRPTSHTESLSHFDPVSEYNMPKPISTPPDQLE